MALGNKIKKLRNARGLSQEDLSALTGEIVSQGAISGLEKRDSASSSFTKILADALGVDVKILLLDEADPCSPFGSDEALMSFLKNAKTNIGSTATPKGADNILIPEYSTGGAMGAGLLLPNQPGIIHGWNVSSQWVEMNARNHTGKSNLAIVTGFGDSMRPMYNPGDPLLVDRGVNEVSSGGDGVYFFRVGDEGFIKRLQRFPTENGMVIKAISANPEYHPFEITENMDFEVLAKVIRVWCGTDF